ncbi:glycoprotein Xg [Sus scrofa]|uniref:glycoprotein Xg n=1 Tax=Sus scrofa TaxID=9823 RepID=UPI000A2B782F|nr:glycoprotein Xg [Sus scrofa]
MAPPPGRPPGLLTQEIDLPPLPCAPRCTLSPPLRVFTCVSSLKNQEAAFGSFKVISSAPNSVPRRTIPHRRLQNAPLAATDTLRVPTGQGDFDLADALDDPEPTKKPSSDIYPKPKPPYPPQPGHPGNSGDIYPRPKPPYPPRPGHPGNGGDVYPRPKPPVHPQPGSYDNSGGFLSDRDLNDGRYPPRPRPPAGGGGGGGGYHPSHGGYGNPSGGGRYRPGPHGSNYGGGDYSTYGNPQGNTIAKIVSPIVSVVVVTLVGAAASYFQYNRRRNCFRTNEPQNV